MIRQEEIKALKEILSENKDSEIKISRSFLKDIVDYFEPKGIMSDKEFAEYAKNNSFLTIVDNQPKIGEWILCSEQLPEERDSMFAKLKGTDKWDKSMYEKISDNVTVTVIDNKGSSITTYAHTTDGQWSCDLLRWNKAFRIIAWQPLPEPYKPENYSRN